ncbi:alpha/beta hydrolase [Alkalihalobacillus oceani]|uniref:Alpha/beta hydrolase n=1 Tax=Halalkalibacter oceani TaxID=1653776 RepID=A0A9X2DVE9_9BACI|nr:alpha/beta hydrolase [Halalkalibacter oceani]
MPGTLCDETLWYHQKLHLKGVKILIADISKDDTVEKMAERLLNSAPESFALAGLSLGGIVAMEVMRQAPERVTRLALIDTNPNSPKPEQVKTWEQQIKRVKNHQFQEVTEKQFFPHLIHENSKQDPKLVQSIKEMFKTVGAEGFINQLKANQTRPKGKDVLPVMTCPVLVLAGKEDALCPPEIHEEMAEIIPNATLVFIENCGHLSTLEQPEAVTDAMQDWLRS